MDLVNDQFIYNTVDLLIQ